MNIDDISTRRKIKSTPLIGFKSYSTGDKIINIKERQMNEENSGI